MKKILLFLLFPAFAFSQTEIDSSIDVVAHQSSILFGKASHGYSFGSTPDCEAWEKFTEWKARNVGDEKCNHDWVYAEWKDVNEVSFITTTEVPPICGKTRTENEARICRHCTRHEARRRIYGRKEVYRKSEFLQLLEKTNDR